MASSLAPSHALNNPVAAGFSLEYANSVEAYVAEQLLPTFRVSAESGRYQVLDPAQNFGQSSISSKRGHLRPSEPIRTSFTSATYLCEAYSRHYPWDDRTLKNAPAGYDPVRKGARAITHQLLIEREVAGFTLMNALTSAIDLAGTANRQWNESAATETSDIRTLFEQIELAVGAMVDDGARMLMFAGGLVDNYLKSGDLTTGTAGANLAEKTKYTQAVAGRNLTNGMLRDYFNVDAYIPMRAVYNTANPGQTKTGGYIWGDMVILAVVDPTPSPDSVTTGWTFATKELGNESGEGFVQWSEPKIGQGGQMLEGEHISVPKLVSTDAVRVLKDVLA